MSDPTTYREGSMVVAELAGGNVTISAAHLGGIVHEGRVVIEKADVFDLFKALKEYVVDRMCQYCGGPDCRGQCENDE